MIASTPLKPMRAPVTVAFAAAMALPVARPEFMPTGVGDGTLLVLNKRGNLNLNLCGVGDGIGAGVGVAVGDASGIDFLRMRFGFGEPAGDSASEGDATLSTGGVASVRFCVLSFGGVIGDSTGVPVSNCD
jgi:hypothetical protein